MAKILILGGGFGGVIAAESLVAKLGHDHQITLLSRNRQFVFYPALVKLAFGKCQREDVCFDLRRTLLNRRVNFIAAEVTRIDPLARKVTIDHGEVEGQLPYDYLIFAMGRRLATERIAGFYENARHVLNVEKALEFGAAVAAFREGRAVFGQCPGARLPVPVFESAFALSRLLKESGGREHAEIFVISPDPPGGQLGVFDLTREMRKALDFHRIEFVPDFPIERVTAGAVLAKNGRAIDFNLLMLLPPFQGSPVSASLGVANDDSYIQVDTSMRVIGRQRIYAVGDCVDFSGPKLGHMAVRQAEVAAANVCAEIEDKAPVAHYAHELRLVIDEGGSDSIYVHNDPNVDEPANVSQGLFWSWAKLAQEKWWQAAHS